MKDEAQAAHAPFPSYLDLHVAEQRALIQLLVVLPPPAHLSYIAVPGCGWRGVRRSPPQITQVTRSLMGDRAHTDVMRKISQLWPVVSDPIWT